LTSGVFTGEGQAVKGINPPPLAVYNMQNSSEFIVKLLTIKAGILDKIISSQNKNLNIALDRQGK